MKYIKIESQQRYLALKLLIIPRFSFNYSTYESIYRQACDRQTDVSPLYATNSINFALFYELFYKFINGRKCNFPPGRIHRNQIVTDFNKRKINIHNNLSIKNLYVI